jgi:peptide deformylase
MSGMEIRTVGDPALRKKAVYIKRISKNIRSLIKDMASTMYEADGVGLAAPQVGVCKRLVVLDVGEGLLVLINPVITHSEGEVLMVEGCLSVPEKAGKVVRAEKVTVEALDENGRKIWVTGEGLLARALLHELDHLDGKLYIDIAEEVFESKAEDENEEEENGKDSARSD